MTPLLEKIYEEPPPPTETALSAVEASVLHECELVIDQGKQAFFDVARALATIREHRLYRATHADFNAYCQERHRFGKDYANRWIRALPVFEEMAAQDIAVPNEYAARQLLALSPEARQAAVETAKAQHGEATTAAEVLAIAKENAPPPSPYGDMAAHYEGGNVVTRIFANEQLRIEAASVSGWWRVVDVQKAIRVGQIQETRTSLHVTYLTTDEVQVTLGFAKDFATARYLIADELLRRHRDDLRHKPAPPSSEREDPKKAGDHDAQTNRAQTASQAGPEPTQSATADAGTGALPDAPVALVPPAPLGDAPLPERPSLTLPATPIDSVGMAALLRNQSDGVLREGRILSPVLLEGRLWIALSFYCALDSQTTVAICYEVVAEANWPLPATTTPEHFWAEVHAGRLNVHELFAVRVMGPDSKPYVFTHQRRRFAYANSLSATDLLSPPISPVASPPGGLVTPPPINKPANLGTPSPLFRNQVPDNPAPVKVAGDLSVWKGTFSAPDEEERKATEEERAAYVTAFLGDGALEGDACTEDADDPGEETETDAAWHEALHDAYVRVAGFAPEMDEEEYPTARAFWTEQMTDLMQICAEQKEQLQLLHVIRRAAWDINWTSPGLSQKRLKEALDAFKAYADSPLRIPMSSIASTLETSLPVNIALLEAITTKRNASVKGKQTLSCTECLEELLQQKAVQLGIDGEVAA